MYLKMITIEKTKGLVTPSDKPPFRWTCHHVKEIFLTSLPRKFSLDGSRKIQITCGRDPDTPTYSKVSGVTNYQVADFGFHDYYASKPHEREKAILQLLRDSFIDIIAHCGEREAKAEKKRIVLDATNKVVSCNFRRKIAVKKLSRAVPSLPLKVQIYRVLSQEDGESWCCEVERNAKDLLFSEWMGKHPEYLYGAGLYATSEFDADVFRVFDNLGKRTYELDMTRFF